MDEGMNEPRKASMVQHKAPYSGCKHRLEDAAFPSALLLDVQSWDHVLAREAFPVWLA